MQRVQQLLPPPYSGHMQSLQSLQSNMGSMGHMGAMGSMGTMGSMGSIGQMGSMGPIGSMGSMGASSFEAQSTYSHTPCTVVGNMGAMAFEALPGTQKSLCLGAAGGPIGCPSMAGVGPTGGNMASGMHIGAMGSAISMGANTMGQSNGGAGMSIGANGGAGMNIGANGGSAMNMGPGPGGSMGSGMSIGGSGQSIGGTQGAYANCACAEGCAQMPGQVGSPQTTLVAEFRIHEMNRRLALREVCFSACFMHLFFSLSASASADSVRCFGDDFSLNFLV